MTQKKEASAKASTPKRHHKDTKYNEYIIDILSYIFFFELGYLLGTIGGLIL